MSRQKTASFLEAVLLTASFSAEVARSAARTNDDSPGPNSPRTILAVEGSHFTVNGHPTFLLGISYYGALAAPEEFIRRDLDDMHRYGFNWLRVWATWESFGYDASAVDRQGQPREPFLGRLKRLVADCDCRGLIVDVTLTRGKETPAAASAGRLSDFPAHQRAVETVIVALKEHRSWYLDLANERDVRDARYVPPGELKMLREWVRRRDRSRLVTASCGGHDLSERDVREALFTAGLDFLSPHRPRDPLSPTQTEAQARACLATMEKAGRVVPVLYQEPFRRGYTAWEPSAMDFLTDLRGAVAGGAAGWCFHNGAQRHAPDNRPRRSFDLRTQRLFDQLDPEERKVVAGVKAAARP
jgi:hypothetical protein